ncbi:YfcC family protein [uncultured Clostridium sp.]|uniref:YfcC family protein n=1 Tax=uncultured Clostridium sp. TaxID=59620 RepID=UPI0025E1DB9D|nr:Na+/H+ antiporter NhaC family protein [uncultured Clostridium sp.]
MSSVKKLKMPGVFAIIMVLAVIVALLTYLIPAGQYEFITEGTRQVVDPDSFHFVEQSPVGLVDFFLSFHKGFTSQAAIIFMMFLVGGNIKVVTDTGAFDALFSVIFNRLQDRAILIIPVMMLLFTILGATGLIVAAVVVFMPLGLMVAKKLKMDPMVGVAIVFLGDYIGFCAAPLAPTSTGLAQSLAGIKMFSGLGFRTSVVAVLFVISVAYTMRYALRVQKDKKCSILDNTDFPKEVEEIDIPFTGRHFAVLMTMTAGLIVFIVGSLNYGWTTAHLAAVMLAVGIISGYIGGMDNEAISDSFISGVQNVSFACMIVGFATTISVIMTNGNIIHTIIYFMSEPLKCMPPSISAIGMYVVNLMFNFFVNSASGQAAIVIPLMAPMADIAGLTRQVAVLAFQYGDGFTNIIFPTSSLLMSCIVVAKVPYSKWLKWILPLFMVWFLVGAAAIFIAVQIGLA